MKYSRILDMYCGNHRNMLAFAEKLTEDQLHWRAAPGTLSIAFYLWHVGRWADHLHVAIPGMTPALSQRLPTGREIWVEEEIGQAWGFDAVEMGYDQTGMEMDEAVAVTLPFPAKEILLDYVRRVFTAVELALRVVDEEQFYQAEQPQVITEGIWQPGSTVGEAIMGHLVHDYRHLGMMECLLGLQTGHGSATV